MYFLTETPHIILSWSVHQWGDNCCLINFFLAFIQKQYVTIIGAIIKLFSPKRCEPIIGGRDDRHMSEFTFKRIHTCFFFLFLEIHDVPQESFTIYQVNLHSPRNKNISILGVGILTVFNLIRYFLF